MLLLDDCCCLSAVLPVCSQDGDHPPTPRQSFIPSPVSQELAVITDLNLVLKREAPPLCLSAKLLLLSIHVQGLVPSTVGSSVSSKQEFYVGKWWWRVLRQKVSCGTLERTRSLQPKPGFQLLPVCVVTSPFYTSSVKWDQSFSSIPFRAVWEYWRQHGLCL